jgi:hypothetical protein
MESVLIADIRPLMAMRHRVVTGHQSHVIRVAIGHVTYRANASRYDTAGEWRREMQRYKLHTMNVYKFENLQKVDHSTEELCIDADGDWVKYEDAAARIRELEAEISERRLDYTEDCKRLDAKIAELEALLAAMTDERDSESRWAKHYSDKVTELE